jgi:hypothetical protein
MIQFNGDLAKREEEQARWIAVGYDEFLADKTPMGQSAP